MTRPWLAMLLALIVAFAAAAGGGVPAGAAAALEIALFGLAAVLLVGPHSTLSLRPLAGWVAFLVVSALSVAWSGCVELGLPALLRLLAELSFFGLALHAAGRRRKPLAIALIAVGIAFALAGLLAESGQLLGLRAFSPMRERIRFSFANPNHFAAFLGLPSWLALGLAARAVGARRLLLLALAAGMQLALLVTASRGGILALAIGYALATLFLVRRRGLALLAGALALVTLFVAVARPERSLERFADAGHDGTVRTEIWRSTGRMIAAHPLLGTGLGSYRHAFPPFQTEAIAATVVNHAHSDPLELVAETGSLGLLSFAFALGLGLRGRWRALIGDDVLGAAATVGCLAFLAHSAVEFPFAIPAAVLMLAGTAAIALAPARAAARRATPSHPAAIEGVDISASDAPLSGPSDRRIRRPIAVMLLLATPLALAPWQAERQLQRADAALRARDLDGAHRAAAQASRFGLRPAAAAEAHARTALAAAALQPEARTRQLESAVGWASQACRACSISAVALRLRGQAKAELGQDGLADLREATRMAPADPGAALDLGRELTGRDAPAAAAELRRAAILDERLLPGILDQLRQHGWSTRQRRDVAPPRASARTLLADHFLAHGEIDDAIEELAAAYASEPTAELAGRHLTALIGADLLDEAAAAIPAYLERHPADPKVTAPAATIYQRLGRLEHALPIYLTRIAAEPRNVPLLLATADLEIAMDRLPAARAHLEAAAAMAPGDLATALALGRLELRLDDPAAAAKTLESAADRHPRDSRPRLLLARAYQLLGRPDDARRELERCASDEACAEALARLAAR